MLFVVDAEMGDDEIAGAKRELVTIITMINDLKEGDGVRWLDGGWGRAHAPFKE